MPDVMLPWPMLVLPPIGQTHEVREGLLRRSLSDRTYAPHHAAGELRDWHATQKHAYDVHTGQKSVLPPSSAQSLRSGVVLHIFIPRECVYDVEEHVHRQVMLGDDWNLLT